MTEHFLFSIGMQIFEGTARSVATDRSAFVSNVFLFFGLALAISAGGVYAGFLMASMYPELFANPLLFYGAMAVELILVFTIHLWQEKRPLAYGIFVLFAFLSGYTLAPLLSFVALTAGLPMIAKALVSTTAMFSGAAIFGWITNKDLSKLGGMLMMAVFGMIIATIINIFLGSNLLEIGVSMLGIVVFTAFTAYDIQMIKSHYPDSMVLAAAMGLFLSFINLFTSILRLLVAWGENS